MKHYDLTTKEGLLLAKELLSNVNPIIAIVAKLSEKILNSDSSKEQAKVAGELIKQGKENDVDEMEITLRNTKGVDLKIPTEGVDVTMTVGANETTTLKVKYK